MKGKRLILPKVRRQDEGTFACRKGRKEQHFKVKVESVANPEIVRFRPAPTLTTVVNRTPLTKIVNRTPLTTIVNRIPLATIASPLRPRSFFSRDSLGVFWASFIFHHFDTLHLSPFQRPSIASYFVPISSYYFFASLDANALQCIAVATPELRSDYGSLDS